MKQLFIALVLINLGFALLQVLFGADEVQAAATLPSADSEILSQPEALVVAPQAPEKQATESVAAADTASASAAASTAASTAVQDEPKAVQNEAKKEEQTAVAAVVSKAASPKAASPKATSPKEAPVSQIAVATEGSCAIAGPFPKEDEATDLVNKLAGFDIESEVQPRDITLLPDYMVYVGPQASKGEAQKLAAEFAGQNIDSHVIGRGNLKNALSLGVFSQAPFADDLLQEMRDQGYDANIATMSLNRRGFQVRSSSLPTPIRSRLLAADTPVIDCPSAVLGAEAIAAVN